MNNTETFDSNFRAKCKILWKCKTANMDVYSM